MTYPTRQWDAEQQDAIAQVQALRSLRVLRDEFLKKFPVQVLLKPNNHKGKSK